MSLRSRIEASILKRLLTLVRDDSSPNLNALNDIAKNVRIIELNVKAFGYELSRRMAEALPAQGPTVARHVNLASKPCTQADIESDYRRCERSANTSIIRADDNFTKSLGEKPVAPFSVVGRTVDSLLDQLAGRIDFIKVDVEGAEPLVIAGARQAVSANPGLTIIMEWSPGQIQSAGFDLGTFLGDLCLTGLQPFDVQENTLSQLSFDELLNLPYRAGIVLKCPA